MDNAQIPKESIGKKIKRLAKLAAGIFLGVIVIVIIMAFISGSDSNTTSVINTQPSSPVVEKTITTPTPTPIPAKAVTKTTPAPTPTPTPTQVPISSETVGQKNAVKKAKSYLGYTAFSHDGLVAQLEYEQFSHVDAVYGADNSGANWNEQAAKKAKSYMEYSAFSRGSLIEQLKHEKFTQEQAEFGANAVGL